MTWSSFAPLLYGLASMVVFAVTALAGYALVVVVIKAIGWLDEWLDR